MITRGPKRSSHRRTSFLVAAMGVLVLCLTVAYCTLRDADLNRSTETGTSVGTQEGETVGAQEAQENATEDGGGESAPGPPDVQQEPSTSRPAGADTTPDAPVVDGPTGPMSSEVAEDTLANAFAGESEMLMDPVEEVSVARSATGAYAETLALRLDEFEDMGWTQMGTPTVTSLQILEEHLEEDPPRVIVLACIDSTNVQILDDRGNELRNAGTPARSSNLYTLVQEQGVWSITNATFPEDPDC